MTVIEVLNAFGGMNSAGKGPLEVKIKLADGTLRPITEIDVVGGVEEVFPDPVSAAPYVTIAFS